MTATKRKAESKKKVWYISRFYQRYELAEDQRYDRKSPLKYTKDFVGGGTDDESCAYWRQLRALQSKPHWLMLRGAFAELKNIAGNMSKAYRGYLLDSRFEPASKKEIGRWLNIDEAETSRILAELEDVGLLEQVDLPQFDTNDSREDGTGNERRKKAKKKTTRAKKASTLSGSRILGSSSGNLRRRTGISGSVRVGTEDSGSERKSLKKKLNTKIKVNGNAEGVNENINGNDNIEIAQINGKGECEGDSAVPEANGEQQAELAATKCRQAALAPATAPPIMPQGSDARGSRVIPFAQAPSGSVHDNRAGPQRIGAILEGMGHRYDQDAQKFAREIYEALGLPWAMESPEAAREIGCFAKQWQSVVKTGLSPPDLANLRVRALAEAQKVAKRQQNRNKAAVWVDLFKRLVKSRLSKAM